MALAIHSIDGLLESLRGSPLLRPDSFQYLVEKIAPECTTPNEVVKALIREKILTIYQAKKILAGRLKELLFRHFDSFVCHFLSPLKG